LRLTRSIIQILKKFKIIILWLCRCLSITCWLWRRIIEKLWKTYWSICLDFLFLKHKVLNLISIKFREHWFIVIYVALSKYVMSVNLLGGRRSHWHHRFIFLEWSIYLIWDAKKIIKRFSFVFINIDFWWYFLFLSIRSMDTLICRKFFSFSNIC